MAVLRYRLLGAIHYGESAQRNQSVILSDRRESKDLRTDRLHSTIKVRRSFDALRLLRMTDGKILRIRPTLFIPSGYPEERSMPIHLQYSEFVIRNL